MHGTDDNRGGDTNHGDERAEREERLDRTFAALANATRRSILARLAHGPATVNELAAPFEMSLPGISKHIKVLERAGLITQGRNAQYRPCSLDVGPLIEIDDWTERYRHIWTERFDQMDEYLERLQPDRATSAGPEALDPSNDPSEATRQERDEQL